jgi:uncharacterized protein (DUF2062 family)
MNLGKHAKKWYRQLISLNGKPQDLALGLTIGVFIGVTPTIPFHTLLIVVFCFLLKKNITAAYLGSWMISNPVTIPFFYVTQYRLGKYVLGSGYPVCMVKEYSLLNLIQRGWDVILPLQIGGVIMAPFFAVPIYFIAQKVFITIRNNRHDHSAKHS